MWLTRFILKNIDKELQCCHEISSQNNNVPISNGRKLSKCEIQNWPLSSTKERYDKVFGDQCSNTYRWSFDKQKSHYQYWCMNGVYKVIFCP
jgi:hypothetical protein